MCEDERYEVDSFLNMTRSTLNALQRLKVEHAKNSTMKDHEFIELRDKYVNNTKIKWIKHIYNWNGNSTDKDTRYDFLNLYQPVILDVIINRLEKIKTNWEQTMNDKQK